MEAISLWLHQTPAGEFLLTMLISMIPIAELRVGIPAGVAMGLPIPTALLAAVIGNLIPVPLIVLFVRKVFKWIRVHIPRLGSFVTRMEQRAYAKSRNINQYTAWGLLLFVAIPLPGTGAWTGSLIAAVMDLRLKSAVPVITLGVMIAGLIITALTYGVTSIL